MAIRLARCFLPFAAGYYLSYAFRAVNAAIGPDISGELSLDPSAFGAMTSVYFATFALAQIPLGVALDRWGPRRTESALLCIAAVGAWIFAQATNVGGLVVGRALIGLGVSSCLMAAFKANSTWWPRERLPLANGLLMGFGGLGAVSATIPVEKLLESTDWRGVIDVMAIATIAVAALIRFGAMEHPRSAAGQESLGRQVREVLAFGVSRPFWRYAALTGITHGTYLAYQTLWAGAWLRDVAVLDRHAVAAGMALVTGAMIFGYPLLGALADALSRRGIATARSFAGYSGLFIILQIPLALGWAEFPLAIWAAFGFLGCGTVLGYAALTQATSAAMAGRVNAAVNLVVFLVAFAVQWAVGAILTIGSLAIGARHAVALGILIGLQALAWLWFILGRPPVSRPTGIQP